MTITYPKEAPGQELIGPILNQLQNLIVGEFFSIEHSWGDNIIYIINHTSFIKILILTKKNELVLRRTVPISTSSFLLIETAFKDLIKELASIQKELQ